MKKTPTVWLCWGLRSLSLTG